ncbi:MAG: insulinase family protein [Phycisphaerales bacterium]
MRLRGFIPLLLACAAALSALALTVLARPARAVSDLPDNPNLRTGLLGNGMRYFLVRHPAPAGAPERIAIAVRVMAGTVNEDDAQRGSARALEMSARRAVAEAPSSAVLRSVGVVPENDTDSSFGFEAVSLVFAVPAADSKTVRAALESTARVFAPPTPAITPESLRDLLALSDQRERAGAGPGMRANQALFPKLLPGTRLAQRLPMGPGSVSPDLTPERVEAFRAAWFVPSNAFVVVAGAGVETPELEAMVRAVFGRLASPPRPEAIPAGDLESRERRALVQADRGLTGDFVQLSRTFSAGARGIDSVSAFADDLATRLALEALDDRLERMQGEGQCAAAGWRRTVFGRPNSALGLCAAMLGGPSGSAAELARCLAGAVRSIQESGIAPAELDDARAVVRAALEAEARAEAGLPPEKVAMRYAEMVMQRDTPMSASQRAELADRLLGRITAAQAAEQLKRRLDLASATIIALLSDAEAPAEEADADPDPERVAGEPVRLRQTLLDALDTPAPPPPFAPPAALAHAAPLVVPIGAPLAPPLAPPVQPGPASEARGAPANLNSQAGIAAAPTAEAAPAETASRKIESARHAATATTPASTPPAPATPALAATPAAPDHIAEITRVELHPPSGVLTAELSTGVTVRHRAMDADDRVEIHIAFARGLKDEPAERRVLLYAAAAALREPAFEGLDAAALRREMGTKGVTWETSVEADAVSIAITSTTRGVDAAFELIRRLSANIVLERTVFERFRSRMGFLAGQLDRVPEQALADFYTRGAHPGDERARLPTQAEIAALTLEQAREFLPTVFRDAAVRVTIVGDIDRARALDLASRCFGPVARAAGTQAERAGLLPVAAGPVELTLDILTADDRSAVLEGFVPEPSADAVTRRSRAALEQVLSLRLTASLRDRLRLTAAVTAAARESEGWDNAGEFWASAPCEVGRESEVARALREGLARIAAEPVTDAELITARQRLAARLAGELADPSWWARTLLGGNTNAATLDQAVAGPAQAQALTSQDLLTAAKDLVREERRISLIVKPKTEPRP